MAEDEIGEKSPLNIPQFDIRDSVGRVERREQTTRDSVRECVESCDQLTAIATGRPLAREEVVWLANLVDTAWQHRHEAGEINADDEFADVKLTRELPLLVQIAARSLKVPCVCPDGMFGWSLIKSIHSKSAFWTELEAAAMVAMAAGDETPVTANRLAEFVPCHPRTVSEALKTLHPVIEGSGRNGGHQWRYFEAVEVLKTVQTGKLAGVNWPDSGNGLIPKKDSSKIPARKSRR
ncbi:MAG: hypothetical protein NTX48_08080 [Planctomycetales bacterium]|nr:hypothetical protein [Planctomycetales bacterium]